jgi:hypothetical protein
MITSGGTSAIASWYFPLDGTMIGGASSILGGMKFMWKLACEAEVEASTTSSTYGVSIGHFYFFLTTADDGPTFGKAIHHM